MKSLTVKQHFLSGKVCSADCACRENKNVKQLFQQTAGTETCEVQAERAFCLPAGLVSGL
jgi:hypothetical protein